MTIDSLHQAILDTLEDSKAEHVLSLDVHNLTSVTDTMIICSGNSNRHVKAIANHVVKKSKELQMQPLGVEGVEEADWVLVDLGDIIIHIMHPKAREFYDLEKLWTHISENRELEQNNSED